jgi:hypothetical protein
VSNADDEMSTPDRALLRALAEALGEQPPADLTERCEGLLAWIDVDAELAELLDEAAPTGVRGSGGSASTLEFTIADRTCVIELVVSPRKLSGHVLGAHAPLATARTVDGAAESAPIDEHGGFELIDPPPGTTRIELDLEDGRRIHTDWFVI